MGLKSYHHVECDGCGRRASDPLFSDDAATKIADMRGYQVDEEGDWLCPGCQDRQAIVLIEVPDGCRIAS